VVDNKSVAAAVFLSQLPYVPSLPDSMIRYNLIGCPRPKRLIERARLSPNVSYMLWRLIPSPRSKSSVAVPLKPLSQKTCTAPFSALSRSNSLGLDIRVSYLFWMDLSGTDSKREETRIMPSDEEEDTTVYTVVVNHEES
jgi:hypothetical protein